MSKEFKTVALLAIAVALGLCGWARAEGISSQFDAGTEDWTVSGDVHGLSWAATIGNPPGSLKAIDDATGDTWCYWAPAKFLGDKSGAYGQTLSYEINISGRDSDPWAVADVMLVGGGLGLKKFFTSPPTPGTWSAYSVVLSEAGGWEKNDGSPPTQAEVQSLLSNLTDLRIRGEYLTGSDYAYLDNVVMVPEPTALILWASCAPCALGAWRVARARGKSRRLRASQT